MTRSKFDPIRPTFKPTEKQKADALAVVKRALIKMRWNDQGGYSSYSDGWNFVACALPHVTPAELDALFAGVGIVPDVIVPKGACADCRFSVNGRERGYSAPCGGCARPYHSNFKPQVKS